jgi:hypothetical protein
MEYDYYFSTSNIEVPQCNLYCSNLYAAQGIYSSNTVSAVTYVGLPLATLDTAGVIRLGSNSDSTSSAATPYMVSALSNAAFGQMTSNFVANSNFTAAVHVQDSNFCQERYLTGSNYTHAVETYANQIN